MFLLGWHRGHRGRGFRCGLPGTGFVLIKVDVCQPGTDGRCRDAVAVLLAGLAEHPDERVAVAGSVDEQDRLPAHGQPEAPRGQGGPEGGSGVGGAPCHKDRDRDVGEVDAGALGPGTLEGRHPGFRSVDRIQPRRAHRGGCVGQALARQRMQDGPVVAAWREALAGGHLRKAVELLPPGEVVVHPDAGAVGLHQGVDAVAVLAAQLDVDRLGEGLALQAELGLEALPVCRPLVLGPWAEGVGVDVIDWPPRPGVACDVRQLRHPAAGVLRHQAA